MMEHNVIKGMIAALWIIVFIGCNKSPVQETAQGPYHTQTKAAPRLPSAPLPNGITEKIAKMLDEVSVENAENFQVRCLEKHCPQGVAALITIEPKPQDPLRYTQGTCTSFLIDSEIVATNSHCLPANYKAGDQCPGVSVIFRPVSKQNAEVRKCRSVKFRTDPHYADKKPQPDLALLSLDTPVSFSPLTVNAQALQEGEKVIVYKINFHEPRRAQTSRAVKRTEASFADISMIECQAHSGTAALLHSKSPDQSIAYLSQCLVHHGNSGSPVLNASGEVKGILQSILDVEGPLSKELKTGAVATQLGCVSELVGPLSAERLSACEMNYSKEVSIQVLRGMLEQSKRNFQTTTEVDLVHTLNEKLSDYQWSLLSAPFPNAKGFTQELSFFLYPIPVCSEKTLSQQTTTIKKVPVALVSPDLDDAARFSYRVIKSQSYTVRLQPVGSNRFEIHYLQAGRWVGIPGVIDIYIPKCPSPN
ncbi:MAG: trypsin-like peptidase domain-containing protein [Oligoflexia bacterium]|nr:trypsin-like peptidase domain-containing protein [Oligoflexia bacterium]